MFAVQGLSRHRLHKDQQLLLVINHVDLVLSGLGFFFFYNLEQ